MFCAECSVGFFLSPLKVGIVLFSFLLSLSLFFLLKKRNELSLKKRLALIYGHIFTLVFPFVFYALFQGCQALLTSCDGLQKVLYLLLITLGISLLLGLLFTPFLYLSVNKKKCLSLEDSHISSFVSTAAVDMRIEKPKVCYLNVAKPLAFSVKYFHSRIFLSIGLLDLLSHKEKEAVLLHELYHLQQRSSVYKYSLHLLHLLSPLAFFTNFDRELTLEEKNADLFAITWQKTDEYILSSKEKMNTFYSYKEP